MKKILWVGLAVAMLLLAPGLSWAQCPAGLTNPLQIIDGQSWTYYTGSSGNTIGQTAIGQFTAHYNSPATRSNRAGSLSLTQTANYQGQLTELLTGTGAYTIDPDCSGGTISLNLAPQQIQFRFVFANNWTEMYLLESQSGGSTWEMGLDVWGTAKLAGTFSCGGAVPITVLNGKTFAFEWRPGFYWGLAPPAAVGVVTANPGGVLTGHFTVASFDTSAITQEQVTGGRFTVDPDCAGGTLFLGNASFPEHFRYVFVSPTFTEMYLLSLDPVNPTGGHARQF